MSTAHTKFYVGPLLAALTVFTVIPILIAFWVGGRIGAKANVEQNRIETLELRLKNSEAETTIEMLRSELDSMRQTEIELRQEIETLQMDLGSVGSSVTPNAFVKPREGTSIRPVGYSTPIPARESTSIRTARTPIPRETILAHKRYWTKADLRWMVAKAGHDYDMTPSRIAWAKSAAVDIVFLGVAESHGDTKCTYTIHKGLWQFAHPSGPCSPNCSYWHISARDRRRIIRQRHGHPASAWRTCGVCSTYRAMRSLRDGGKSAWHQHWAATLNR